MKTPLSELALTVYPYAYCLFVDESLTVDFIGSSLLRFALGVDQDELDHMEINEANVEKLCYHLYLLGLEKKDSLKTNSSLFFYHLPYEVRSIIFLKMKWNWSVERIARVLKLTTSQVMINLEHGKGLLYQDHHREALQ